MVENNAEEATCTIRNTSLMVPFTIRPFLEEAMAGLEPTVEADTKLIFSFFGQHAEPKAMDALDTIMWGNDARHNKADPSFVNSEEFGIEGTTKENIFGDQFYSCLGHSSLLGFIAQGEDKGLPEEKRFYHAMAVSVMCPLGLKELHPEATNVNVHGAIKAYQQFRDVYALGLSPVVAELDLSPQGSLSMEVKRDNILVTYVNDKYSPGTEQLFSHFLKENNVFSSDLNPEYIDIGSGKKFGGHAHHQLGTTSFTGIVRRKDPSVPGDDSTYVGMKLGTFGRYNAGRDLSRIVQAAKAMNQFVNVAQNGGIETYLTQHNLR